MLEIGRTLSTESEREVLRRIQRLADTVVDARNMTVHYCNGESQTLESAMSFEHGTEAEPRRSDCTSSSSNGRGGDCKPTPEHLIVGSWHREGRRRAFGYFSSSPIEAWLEEEGVQLPISPLVKSWLGVPMLLPREGHSQERPLLGILSLNDQDVAGAFGEQDLEVLQAIADQAAVAITNVRAHSRSRMQMEQMKQVAADSGPTPDAPTAPEGPIDPLKVLEARTQLAIDTYRVDDAERAVGELVNRTDSVDLRRDFDGARRRYGVARRGGDKRLMLDVQVMALESYSHVLVECVRLLRS